MKLVNPRLYRVAAASILGGMLIGVAGGLFRFFLNLSDHFRTRMIARAHLDPHLGWLLPVLIGAAGAFLARLLVVKLAPTAEGSGVQRVEAVFSGEIEPASAMVVPVKFVGGLLAMGGGLALGREGPTVQMGASFGEWVSKFLLHDEEDRRVVQAASAGAGLAVAFNAPIGGSIFVFEELTSNITPWLLVSTLAAATVAVWLMRLMLGNTFSFTVPQVSPTENWTKWPFLALGALLGVAGAVYNVAVMWLLRLTRQDDEADVAAAGGHHRRDGRRGGVVRARPGGRRRRADPDDPIQSIRGGKPGNDFRGALRDRPVVLRCGMSRRIVRAAAGAGSVIGSAIRRRAESFVTWAGTFSGSLRHRRHGSVVHRQRARAVDRDCADGGDDRPRRSDSRAAGRIVDRDAGDHAAAKRAHLRQPETKNAVAKRCEPTTGRRRDITEKVSVTVWDRQRHQGRSISNLELSS